MRIIIENPTQFLDIQLPMEGTTLKILGDLGETWILTKKNLTTIMEIAEEKGLV